MQATLVSYYRNKRDSRLVLFLDECQDLVAGQLHGRFRKYAVDQIHGTVVGLERTDTGDGSFTNRNFHKFRNEDREMDFDGFLGFLRCAGPTPFQLQIGGFQERDYPFASRNQRPYWRSFSIQEKNVVVMGWPLRGRPLDRAPSSDVERAQESRLYPTTLDSVRSAAQRFNILHAYHREPTETDNDFFFRIGMVDEPETVKPTEKQALTRNMCDWLSARPPLVMDVQLCDLSIASYQSEELSLDTTHEYSLTERVLTGSFMKTLYADRE